MQKRLKSGDHRLTCHTMAPNGAHGLNLFCAGVEMKTDFLFSLSFVFTFFRIFLFSLSFIFMDNSENWYIYFWIKVISDISLFSWKVIFHISRKCFHLSTVKCWNKIPLSYWWRNKTLFERSILLLRKSFCFYCISL